MSARRLFRGAVAATVLAVAGSVLCAPPSNAASVEWAPLPGGYEALRLTGPGLGVTSPTNPAFNGSTFTFNALKTGSSSQRLISIGPGQDLPKNIAPAVGLREPTSRVATPYGLFTTTTSPAGAVLHQVTGNTSRVISTLDANTRLVGHVGRTLILKTFDAMYVKFNLDAAPGNQLNGRFNQGFMASNSFYYTESLGGVQTKWGRVTTTGDHTLVVAEAGQQLHAGLGLMGTLRPFKNGAIVTASHQVHGDELWYLPNDNGVPRLLTNVNDNGSTTPIVLMGELNNRMWFSIGGATNKVFSTAGVFGDLQEEMAETAVGFPFATQRVGDAIVSVRFSDGVHAYRSGAGTPTMLINSFTGAYNYSPDNKRLYVATKKNSITQWYATDGSTLGTKVLGVFRPQGYELPFTEPGRSVLLPWHNNTLAYQLKRGTAFEQFLYRPDRTVRLLKVTRKAKQRVNRKQVAVKVKVRAGEKVTSTASATIKIPGARPIKFKTSRLSTAKDRTGTLVLRLPKAKQAKVVRALNQKRKVIATIKVIVRDANAGNQATRTVKVRLF